MYAFWLGREFKLSLAEIHQSFPKTEIEYISKNICILNTQNKSEILKKVAHMGGTIKVIELFSDYRGKPQYNISDIAEGHEGKFAYGVTVLGGEKNLKALLIDTKKTLKAKGVSSRFVNKNFGNLTSAQIIGENLVKRGSDFTLVVAGNTEYFGKTIWVQDIEAYSKRDYGKARDMEVGMLPPKLAQMMINIAQGDVVYDPFCGLGTLLIESILMGNSEIYGSDISAENIEKTKKNINFARKEFENNLKTSMTQVLDAKGISSSPFLKKTNAIVSEGYLGKVFQKYSITEEKIEEEKRLLLDIYTKFFAGLKKANYSGVIVISFPFWDIRGKYHYFNEVYDVVQKHAKNLPMLPKHDEFKHTKSGSLLYKRPDQIVGREIFKLKIR